MATKLVPIEAGKPGKQLDIFDEMFNKQEEQQPQQRPCHGTHTPTQTNPNGRLDPNKTKGTYQSFRL